jgi:hypothetical protein
LTIKGTSALVWCFHCFVYCCYLQKTLNKNLLKILPIKDNVGEFEHYSVRLLSRIVTTSSAHPMDSPILFWKIGSEYCIFNLIWQTGTLHKYLGIEKKSKFCVLRDYQSV